MELILDPTAALSLLTASTNKGMKSPLATASFTMGPVSIFVRPEKTWQDSDG